MEDVTNDIAAGNLWQALIRLWLLAESTVDGRQQLATWWQDTYDQSSHDIRVASLIDRLDRLQPGDTFTADEVALPLAVIEALDRHLGEEPIGAFHAGMTPELCLSDVRYWLVRRDWPPKPSTPAGRQHPNLEAWFKHFHVVPSRIVLRGATLDVTLKSIPAITTADADMPMRAHITHFEDGVALRIEEDAGRKSFVVKGLDDTVRRRKSLRREFEFAVAFRAAVWVVPELSVTPDLAGEVAGWLAELPESASLLLAVPGSFHVELPARPGACVNRAMVLNGVGRQMAQHDKLTCFGYARPGGDGAFTESILPGRRIELLVTPIGLVGVAICKDFSDAATELVHTAWSLLAPDWLLVPSMGHEADTVKRHLERADEHWRLRGMRSVVANQEPAVVGGPVPAPAGGFVCIGAGYANGRRKRPAIRPDLKLIK